MRISEHYRQPAAEIAGFHGMAMVMEGSVCISNDCIAQLNSTKTSEMQPGASGSYSNEFTINGIGRPIREIKDESISNAAEVFR